MAKPLLPGELWELIEPLLPPQPPRPKGGRPPIPNRAALTGILFVPKTGKRLRIMSVGMYKFSFGPTRIKKKPAVRKNPSR